MLGKRERPSCEEETVVRLTSVFDKIKAKYQDSLSAIMEETKDDPLTVVHNWCGAVIKLCSKEFPKVAQKHLLEAIRDSVDLEKSLVQPQEKPADNKPVKIDLVESLIEIVTQFQLKVMTYENDL
jgi:hypothetical protein